MKYSGNNKLNKAILSFLAIGIMFFGVLSIVLMNHEMNMDYAGSTVSQSSNCPDSHNAQSCLSYHLGIMHNLSAATYGSLLLQPMSLLLFSFIGLFVLALFEILEYGYTRRRTRFRQLYEKTITAFALQLGYWLTLFEKRDPALRLCLA